jgi:site-specific recombinase XerD
MNVVYFFDNDKSITAHSANYDPVVFHKLSVCGGHWDKTAHNFSFPGIFSTERFTTIANENFIIHVSSNGTITHLVPEISGESKAKIYTVYKPSQELAVFSESGTVRTGSCINTPKASDVATGFVTFPAELERKLLDALRERKYSAKTAASYLRFNQELCRESRKTPDQIQSEDFHAYLSRLGGERDLSASTMNLAISSFRFFYNKVLKRDCMNEQRRPKKDRRLPVALTKSEVKRLFEALENPKHRLLLMLAYSSGLRVSELVSLRLEHIDMEEKTVFVKEGKGRKDRYTMLSDMAANALKIYCQFYSISGWLFPGQNQDEHLSTRSAQRVFENALSRAGIEKDASIHSLRQSCAPHLLESGTSIIFIKELLGHESVRTTERYTHIARTQSLKVPSPLDTPD